MAVERWVSGKLAGPLEANGAREFYQPVMLERKGGEVLVRPLAWKGSADLFTLAGARGLFTAKAFAAVVLELHPEAWAVAGADRATGERLLAEFGVRAVPLTGQREPLAQLLRRDIKA